jgi:hypothetical protein
MDSGAFLARPRRPRATNVSTLNGDKNKPADKDTPRGMSDERVDGDTLDITDDPAKEEKEPLVRSP